MDERQEWTYCVYRADASTALGGVALALLLVGQVVAAVASRCFCCGSALRPGGGRACALVLFLSSWYCYFFPADPNLLRSSPNSSPALLAALTSRARLTRGSHPPVTSRSV